MIMKIQAWIYRPAEEILYLLLKRREDREGYWTPVTGHVEKGERTLDALYREVQEETGIANLSYVLDLRIPFRFSKNGEEYEEHCFGVQVDTDTVHISNEHSAYEWLDYGSALSRLKWDEHKRTLEVLNDMVSI